MLLYEVNEETFDKSVLLSLQQQYQNNLVVINANMIASLMHINIAVSRAIINMRDS